MQKRRAFIKTIESFIRGDFLRDNKNKKRVRPSSFFPRNTIREFVKRHAVGNKTRVAPEALDLLNKLFDEVGGWIVIESEKMASSSGKSTIKAEHIRDAARLYLGWEEKE
jgi:histone H3/H4